MTQDQRAGMGAGAVFTVKMDVDVLDLRLELRKAVELGFPFSPVIGLDPIGAKYAHEFEIGAVGPAVFQTRTARHLVPFIGAHFLADCVQRCVRDFNAEGSRRAHGKSPFGGAGGRSARSLMAAFSDVGKMHAPPGR